MNQLNLLKSDHLIKSDSRLDELIDHIGDLLAEEYFQIMEESLRKQHNENEQFGE